MKNSWLLCAVSCFALTACICAPATALAAYEITGYASASSVIQGGSIDLHVSTTSPTYSITIIRDMVDVLTITNLAGSNYPVPGNAWADGAGWPVAYTISVPANWPSGIYTVKFLAEDNSTKSTHFVVREDNPGSTAKILTLDNSTTLNAYNNWGGKSLYSYNSDGNISAVEVSFHRPPKGNNIDSHEVWFSDWMKNEGIPMEHASMLDLDSDPFLLANYSVVVLVGHSEYWSKSMRDNFDQFVQAGGNAIILSGNTMYWQVRIEGSKMLCYKLDWHNDPMYGVNNDLVTNRWSKAPVNDPENRSIGVGWRNGGYVNIGTTLLAADGYGGYTITNADHWIYTGVELQNGDQFGYESTIVGYEVDGALFDWINGVPVVTGEDGTPLNFQILAHSPASKGSATMGIFKYPDPGGYVFNAATIDWADGLKWGTHTKTITRNVIEQFGGLPASMDNCPNVFNPDQADFDNDGLGDACDSDMDNDGTPNDIDLFPLDPTEDTDTDLDGIGNNADTDDDNDGLTDTDEIITYGTNPLLADTDGDGIDDGTELLNGTNPLDPNDFILMGDINSDGKVNVADFLLLTQFLLGTRSIPTATELNAGDMNRNNQLDAGDLVIHSRTVLGIL